MMIGPSTLIARNEAGDGSGYIIRHHGTQQYLDWAEVWETAEDAWKAWRKLFPNEPNLDKMARAMVGDACCPNIYFVTVDGKTLVAFDGPDAAKLAQEYAEHPEKMGVFTPAAQEYPIVIEDRLNGVVWMNGAAEAEQEVEDEKVKEGPEPEPTGTPIQRALEAFNVITATSYYGFAFREYLAQNPKALKAAEELAASFKSSKALSDLVNKGERW